MTDKEEEIRHRAEKGAGDYGWLNTVNYLLSIIDTLRQKQEKAEER